MLRSTVTSKGQITIPKPVRERLNLQAGDRVDFVVDEERGVVTMRPEQRDVRTLRGLLRRPKRAKSVKQMDRAVRKRVANKHRR